MRRLIFKTKPCAISTMLRTTYQALWPAIRLGILILLPMHIGACGQSVGSLATENESYTTRGITGTAPSSTAPKTGSGDKLRITVFNEPQLSGEFVVNESGAIAFPLIGQTMVAGRNTREIEQLLKERLNGRYLVNPNIGVEIVNQQPFYIMGEVANAGEYPYRPGLNVIGAIATAGGFSPRAATSRVTIRRGSGGKEQEYPARPDIAIYPGDMITVPERIF